jgi:hypothetical protein
LTKEFVVTAGKLKVSWCCDEGRMFLIWALACGVDDDVDLVMELEGETSTPSAREPRRFSARLKNALGGASASANTVPKQPADKAKPNNTPASPAPTQTPPSHLAQAAAATAALPEGVGYGGVVWNWVPTIKKLKRSKGPGYTTPSTEEEDLVLENYFRALVVLLPGASPSRKSDEPISNVELLLQSLTRSPLLRTAADLLRNTCLEDMAKREGLYLALLQLFESLFGSLTTRRVVTDPLTLYPEEEQVLAYTLQPGSRASASARAGKLQLDDAFEKTDSLVSILESARELHDTIVKHAVAHASEFASDDGKRMIRVSKRFVELATTVNPPKSKGILDLGKGKTVLNVLTRSMAAEEKKAAAGASLGDSSIGDIDEQLLLKSFFFEKLAATISAPAKGRMKKLITDVGTMQASLPAGIYVRYGSSRLDVMKVLIAGPQGTPYAYGLFEFDLFCPNTFPTQPPQMRLKTTGSGRVRFNPNLYNDGTGMFVSTILTDVTR